MLLFENISQNWSMFYLFVVFSYCFVVLFFVWSVVYSRWINFFVIVGINFTVSAIFGRWKLQMIYFACISILTVCSYLYFSTHFHVFSILFVTLFFGLYWRGRKKGFSIKSRTKKLIDYGKWGLEKVTLSISFSPNEWIVFSAIEIFDCPVASIFFYIYKYFIRCFLCYFFRTPLSEVFKCEDCCLLFYTRYGSKWKSIGRMFWLIQCGWRLKCRKRFKRIFTTHSLIHNEI